ncbi:L-aspartate oxidase /nicotinate-nucleotide pyrophosphorylase [carboxylating] [Haloactinospora alba]|uniref:L-aspartate oxidase n=1 Tax=Haloactinospora alba TaxID=405555 RepID=A0A543NMU7_9ACTN|nr:L-aspartate oxidase [Haloactinospora alba]TQN33150.1 L-aspartate oxidase /nicotinate-nucleotide pyrophosphorylase [carboxylating] [Haloactinospora alba]
MPALPHALPLRLSAPEPSWSTDADVVVVGSGIAGLSTALGYVRRVPDGTVVLLTKDRLANGSTRWAQGGIAAATVADDHPVAHMQDTVLAGAGMCDPLAVHILATEGPDALRGLVEAGAAFDRTPEGELELTREGGHRAHRVAHAGGDATGAEIQRALTAAVRAQPRIRVLENALALDARTGETADGGAAVCGVTLHTADADPGSEVGAVRARAVVLATGGTGQVYSATTNPAVSTGDGLALAARAGARLRDLEFVQFHPTVLWLGEGSRGQQPLVSEAVRGEGAVLTDTAGNPLMEGVHELGDLAPRDIVAATIARSMAATGDDHVLLDGRSFGERKWRHRFPTILKSCRAHGIDPVTDPVPVAPAAHYSAGGVAVDTSGRTSLSGLFAVGEAARTGVHGANRLASNSLVEGVVFADRIADTLAHDTPPPATETPPRGRSGLVSPDTVPELRALMSGRVGVLRDGNGLRSARESLAGLVGDSDGTAPGPEAWEATNLATVAAMITHAALIREESRGAHQRADFPEADPRLRARPSTLRLTASGEVTGEHPPVRVALPPALRSELDAVAMPLTGSRQPHDRPDLLHPHQAPHEYHTDTVRRALAEDLTGGPQRDVTTVATIPDTQTRTADIVARASGVVAGLPLAELALWIVTEGVVRVERHTVDGERVKPGEVLLTATARTRDLLTAERTALNLLTTLSGIATATRNWVDAVAGTGAGIRDSRKTRPGLRALEKYAVRCGGGVNHRFGLADAALIKDNHVAAAGGVAAAVRAVRETFPGTGLEVEVDHLDQIEPALAAGADEILLDNFTAAQLREAVALVAGRARLESSGGLTLPDAADVAATGVDYLAVGALTHSSPALDIALDLRTAS